MWLKFVLDPNYSAEQHGAPEFPPSHKTLIKSNSEQSKQNVLTRHFPKIYAD